MKWTYGRLAIAMRNLLFWHEDAEPSVFDRETDVLCEEAGWTWDDFCDCTEEKAGGIYMREQD